MEQVTFVIKEEVPGKLEFVISGVPDTTDNLIGGPEFMALTMPQRFALVLNSAFHHTELGKILLSKCLTPLDEDEEEERRGPKYPCRCRIIDPEGEKVWEDETHEAIALQNPSKAVPKLGRCGTAFLEPDGRNVRIQLDDGSELMGYECWWEPIADTN